MRAFLTAALVAVTVGPAFAADDRPLRVDFQCRSEPEAKADLQRRGFTPAASWQDGDGDTWVLLLRQGGEAVFGVLWRDPDGGMQFCGLPGRAQMGSPT